MLGNMIIMDLFMIPKDLARFTLSKSIRDRYLKGTLGISPSSTCLPSWLSFMI
jgi:hypothetical protein